MNILFTAFILAFTVAVEAANPKIYSFNPPGVAVEGYDATTFHTRSAPLKGHPRHHLEWRGARWHFLNEENLRMFQRNPELYAPQYGGYCVWAIAHGRSTGGFVKFWKIVDGKLYLLCSQSALENWLKDRENIERKADERWPDILYRDQ